MPVMLPVIGFTITITLLD